MTLGQDEFMLTSPFPSCVEVLLSICRKPWHIIVTFAFMLMLTAVGFKAWFRNFFVVMISGNVRADVV